MTDAAAKSIELCEDKPARNEIQEESARTATNEALYAVRYNGIGYVIARRLHGITGEIAGHIQQDAFGI